MKRNSTSSPVSSSGLSSASEDALAKCPKWEQRKYVAFGATVLVPTLFALIAASYAVYTLTTNWLIIIPIALVWGFIILSVDRALLATYRSYLPMYRRTGQFVLRIMVAILMGLTISHPLALLLFKDTIVAEIEEARGAEIAEVREAAAAEKAVVENRIGAVETTVAQQRAKWDETFNAKFLANDEDEGDADVAMIGENADEMKAEIELANAPKQARITEIDAKLETEGAAYRKVQEELSHWQTEFEKEVNGQRSGIVGVGPRARSIQTDQLEWRRTEGKRLGTLIEELTNERQRLNHEIAEATGQIRGEFKAAAQAVLAEAQAERERVAALKHQVQQEQAALFVDQQNTVRSAITAQIDTNLAEIKRLQGELNNISEVESERINAIRMEPRRDILTQTLAMHHLFGKGQEGGTFALSGLSGTRRPVHAGGYHSDHRKILLQIGAV